jgi:hypothetical protein
VAVRGKPTVRTARPDSTDPVGRRDRDRLAGDRVAGLPPKAADDGAPLEMCPGTASASTAA